MNKKLKIIVMVSICIAIISFVIAGFIGANMLPYQDPTPELLKQYNYYVKIYTPIWYILIIFFLISSITFLVSIIKLLIRFIKKDKNISNIT